MATCTAQITVGAFPGCWGGENRGIGPFHVLYLVEGSRAAWVLEPVRHAGPDASAAPVTWVAGGPQRILADALVMIAARLEKNDRVLDLIQRLGPKASQALLEGDWADLTELQPEDLTELEAAARTGVRATLVVTAMHGSSITGQLGLLERCAMPAEACVASWVRHPDSEGNLQAAGSLPPEDPDEHAFSELRI